MDTKVLNKLLDELYVELLNLIEQHTQCRVNIERLSNITIPINCFSMK